MTEHATRQPVILLRNLRKSFGTLEVLKGITFDAYKGDVIAILGSSGSGKSTMLRCINMLEIPTAGDVTVGEETVRLRQHRGGLAIADRRQIDGIRSRAAMVFQSFNLWSHMTILENLIEAPIHVQRRPRAECVAEAMALLEKVGIADKRDAYPTHLSGGQQQRRRDRARVGHASPGDAVRRTDLRPRSRKGRRGAGGDAVPGKRRTHHAAGHA